MLSCGMMKIKREKKIPPIPPGEILLEEFLKPMSISQYRLANDIDVPRKRIHDIVQSRRGITASTALRLGNYFGMSPQFWSNLQTHYDREVEADRFAGQLKKEVRTYAAAV